MSDLTRLKTYPNEMEAHLWAGVLEDQGVHAMVKPEMGGYGWGHDSFMPHSVLVLTDDIEIARRIIQNDEES